MNLKIGNYELDIDKERTRAYYEKAAQYECECLNCKNYSVAISYIPKETMDFFSDFCVDPAKVMRASMLFPIGEEILYDCRCRLVGKIKPYPQSAEIMKGEADIKAEPINGFFVTGTVPIAGVCVSFSDDIRFFYPSVNFPRPCIEMSFFVKLQWKLDVPFEPEESIIL